MGCSLSICGDRTIYQGQKMPPKKGKGGGSGGGKQEKGKGAKGNFSGEEKDKHVLWDC